MFSLQFYVDINKTEVYLYGNSMTLKNIYAILIKIHLFSKNYLHLILAISLEQGSTLVGMLELRPSRSGSNDDRTENHSKTRSVVKTVKKNSLCQNKKN